MGITRSLVKIYEDYQTYVFCTKAGLLQSKRHEFNGREEFIKVIEDLNIEDFKGIWGKIVVEVK